MEKNFNNLFNEFKTYFPNIDFSSIPEDWGGYDKLEAILAKHVLEFTRKQWEVILDYKYSDLFQSGTPHYSWNTDREHLYNALYNAIGQPRPVKVWDETWVKCTRYCVTTPTGVVIEMKEEHPHLYGYSSCRQEHYHMTVKDGPAEPVPTHCAVTLGYDKTSGAFLNKQFTGTFDQCVDWVAKSGCPNCKIFELK